MARDLFPPALELEGSSALIPVPSRVMQVNMSSDALESRDNRPQQAIHLLHSALKVSL